MNDLTTAELHDELQKRYGDPGDFVDRVRALQERHGFNQSDIARKAGYDPTNVSRWLRLVVTPSLQTMIILEEAAEALAEEIE